MIGIETENKNVHAFDYLSQAPSLFDYEIVIVDIDALFTSTWKDQIENDEYMAVDDGTAIWVRKLIDRLSTEAKLLMDKGGMLVCLLRPTRGLKWQYWPREGPKATKYARNYDWIPVQWISSHIVAGLGTNMKVHSDAGAFSPYMAKGKTYWTAYLDDLEKLQYQWRVLAVNEAGKPVAADFSLGKGTLILLPLSNHEKCGDILIECAVGAFEKPLARPPPSWIEKIRMPGEDVDLKHLNELSSDLSKLQEAYQRTRLDLEEKTLVKRILYEKDKALEEAVRKAFEELGFTLRREGDKDWIASSDAREAILEVTGSDGSIDIDKLRQLLNYLIDDYKETGIEKKAILVGDHFANDPPGARGEPFTNKVLAESDVHSICLLSTLQLFKMICYSRDGKMKAADIRKKILESIGICELG